MDNAFDSSNYPDGVPAELTAGSRWAWTRADITAAYRTDTYTLRFRFSLLDSPYTDYEVEAGKTGSAHVVEVASASTANYTAGAYSWAAVVVRVCSVLARGCRDWCLQGLSYSRTMRPWRGAMPHKMAKRLR